MCTIIATFNENQPQHLRAMAEAVRHRGPDSLEVWHNERHGLAACRLTIFGDPYAPMIYHDPCSGRKVLLNGEIYNYTKLWNQLNKTGVVARTDLEAELIARLYDLYGEAFAEKLQGMFAIAILDGSKLVMVRDRFGIKPLYYIRFGERILVSSEIKGILAHPDVTPVLNLTALRETRVFGYVISTDQTFFKNIRQVQPGHVLRIEGSGRKYEFSFGKIPKAHYSNGSSEPDYEESVLKTRQIILRTADTMFNHGDMDKGIFLSGGLDSSTIALAACLHNGKKVRTFTLADSDDTPDLLAARQVAGALKTDHYEYRVTIKDYWRCLPDYVAHYEGLMAGGVFHIQGGLAFHILSRFISEHVKVAFSGEGADELFGGYYWIYTHPLGFSDRIRNNLAAIQNDPYLSSVVDDLFPEPEDEAVYRKNLFDFLLQGGLANYHLQSVDRSAGAFGMEIRPFYLDDSLSQWAMDLPIEYKVPNKQTTKKILRDAFRQDFNELGLETILTRQKMGMPSALSAIDQEINKVVKMAITDEDLAGHPYGKLLGSKMNLLLFDLFEHIFFKGWDHHSKEPPHYSFLGRVWPT
ncbi:MAG: asparagine synthase (glutamine-hydrolyzing) [Desulfosalsimonadaceae bacterium]